MTPRENFLSLYRRTGFEFAPVTLGLCPALRDTYKAIAGDTPMPEHFDYPEGFSAINVPGPIVTQACEDWSQYYPNGLKEGTHIDHWGVAHEPGSEAVIHMSYMRHPLGNATSLEQIQSFPFPVFDCENIDHICDAVDDAHNRGLAARVDMACTVWEVSWYIRDMTQLMMDMMTDDPKATYLLDTITEMSCQRAAAYARAGIDLLHLGDDVGMQNAIMMSQDLYRAWLKPRLAKVIQAAKAENPDLIISYHSCGYVEPLIDDLIEAGIEVLNPVQPECMDFAEIHEKYGDRLSFNGTLGTQTTMPFGTPDEVRETVFRNLEIAGDRGGLLCCPTHLLEPEVPWANIEAYVRACKEFKTAGG